MTAPTLRDVAEALVAWYGEEQRGEFCLMCGHPEAKPVTRCPLHGARAALSAPAPSDYQQRIQSAIDALPSAGGVVDGSAPSEPHGEPYDRAYIVQHLRADAKLWGDCPHGYLLDQAALALSQRADGWVACSERLPLVGERVEVVIDNHGGPPSVHIGARPSREFGEAWMIFDIQWRAVPSHWRPLPAPPEQEATR